MDFSGKANQQHGRTPSSYFIVLLVLFSTQALAQFRPVPFLRDTLIGHPLRPVVIDTSSTPRAVLRTDTGAYHPAKSPWLAVGLSAVVPGVGQIYDASYWKAPVIWGVGGYWVYEWGHLNSKYHEFGDRFDETHNDNYRSVRDFYRDERDKFAWFLGALYLLNVVDAYVGAQLYDFDVSPDLGADGRIMPRVTATLRLKF